MKEFKTLTQERYTTKEYDATKKIPQELIDELKQILRMSPSSINSQPWHFTFVSKPEIKEELAKVSLFNEPKVRNASHVVVFSVIDKVELLEKHIKENLPERVLDYYDNMLKPHGNEAVKAWMEHQVYLSLGFFLSACALAGVDSTPMEGINTAEYDHILAQKDYRALFAVAIGYRDENDSNRPAVTPKSRLDIDKVVSSV
ncbi:MAG: nitroreductase family protein [Bacteroidales bacterium]